MFSPAPISPLIPAASAGIQCDLSPDPVVDKSYTKSEIERVASEERLSHKDSKPCPESSIS